MGGERAGKKIEDLVEAMVGHGSKLIMVLMESEWFGVEGWSSS
jgi:hypothetical protein